MSGADTKRRWKRQEIEKTAQEQYEEFVKDAKPDHYAYSFLPGEIMPLNKLPLPAGVKRGSLAHFHHVQDTIKRRSKP